jgi:hypothetical protein
MVTDVPTGPAFGDKLLIVGTGVGPEPPVNVEPEVLTLNDPPGKFVESLVVAEADKL